MNTNDIIHAYTRAEAIEDGFQVDVSETAREAGISFPVFLTRAVYDAYVTVPPNVSFQNESGRLWDIIWMLRFAIKKSCPGSDRIPVTLHVRNNNRAAKLVRLVATCGALDIDDPRPAIVKGVLKFYKKDDLTVAYVQYGCAPLP